ncbi:hypothetical protein LCGC14_0652490 [marine sediment metagenome]|uniref:Uncharacterized protein n=1 Tax=marine sediment metagenome TaxID=412755 RepID=A0A0F9THN5_9ZZZZ
MSNEIIEKVGVDETVDISELPDLAAQKECCEKMIDTLFIEEKRLKSCFISSQTIYDLIDENEKLRSDMGEYVGYHYGSINISMDTVTAALVSLKKFSAGDLDNIDHGARGMYISIWFNMAVSSIISIDLSATNLEELESEMIKKSIEEHGENLILTKGTVH